MYRNRPQALKNGDIVTDKLIFIIGVAVSAVSTIAFIISLFWGKLKKERLKHTLDEEYGK